MQISAIRNFNYGQSLMAHKAVENPQPEQKPVQDEGLTASLYFTGNKKGKGNVMRNATMAGVGSLLLLTTVPSLTSCDKDTYNVTAMASDTASAIANADADANANATVNIHARGCCCDTCRNGKDTVYKYITLPGDTQYIYVPQPGDTVYLPGDTVHHTDTVHHHDTTYIEVPKEIPVYVYVDTGSYHVTHDTITKWIDRWQKPIPLDTLHKWTEKFDIDGGTPGRNNIVNYQAIREWEYGDRFVANMNQLESSKNILVYDREDLDWTGNHRGWGKDVYRIPTSNFKIQTYSGKTLNSPKGIFFETYVNPWDQNTSIYDNNLVQRYFFQTAGDKVNVYSYDAKTGLYREDGEFSKGYLDKSSVGSNILLTDLIASDPDIKWSNNPDYSTEDHMVGVKVVTVNDEELQLMYVRAKDDEFAEQHYGVANN
ncbi:hypothetical protein IJ674_06405 [bacterium]|nr:hypothetical protein [bacterium]